uniref:Uncharacterized protein n=1 Tax=Rhizophora mucronata TaxID=61149 RepID=A0A2P2N7P1_RHIMU
MLPSFCWLHLNLCIYRQLLVLSCSSGYITYMNFGGMKQGQ